MKLFIVLSAVIALTLGQVLQENSVDGGYHFGYNDGQSSRQEIQTADGVVRGAYSFIDANGEIQLVQYTSDAVNGFQVVTPSETIQATPTAQFDLNGIPLPVTETPEVMAARLEHFEAVRRAQGISAPPSLLSLPQAVVDTPEVMAARAAHFKAFQQAQYAATPVVLAPPVNTHYNVLRQFAPIPQISFNSFGVQDGQVQYTPEVAAARSAHFAAVNEAIRINGGF